MQGICVVKSMVPIAMHGLSSESEALRKAAVKALVAIMRQAADPSQQTELCCRLAKAQHVHAIAKLNFLESGCCMLDDFSATLL